MINSLLIYIWKKEFRKWVNSGQCYGQEYGILFFFWVMGI